MTMRAYLLASISLFCVGGGATAGPITWILSPVSLGQAFTGTVTGQFTYDATTNIYSNWSISTSNVEIVPGLAIPPILDSSNNPIPLDVHFTPATSIISFSNAAGFGLQNPSGSVSLSLDFCTPPLPCPATPLTDSGGTTQLLAFDVVRGHTVDIPEMISFNAFGFGSATSAPEPTPFGAAVLGGAVLGVFALKAARSNRLRSSWGRRTD